MRQQSHHQQFMEPRLYEGPLSHHLERNGLGGFTGYATAIAMVAGGEAEEYTLRSLWTAVHNHNASVRVLAREIDTKDLAYCDLQAIYVQKFTPTTVTTNAVRVNTCPIAYRPNMSIYDEGDSIQDDDIVNLDSSTEVLFRPRVLELSELYIPILQDGYDLLQLKFDTLGGATWCCYGTYGNPSAIQYGDELNDMLYSQNAIKEFEAVAQDGSFSTSN